jgi:hypothetical protein
MNDRHPMSVRHSTMSRLNCTAWTMSQRSLAILGVGFSGERPVTPIGIGASAGDVVGALGLVLWQLADRQRRIALDIRHKLPIAVGTVVLADAFVCDARREDKAAPLDLLVDCWQPLVPEP